MAGAVDGAASAAPRPHHLRALDKANWLRGQRSQLKKLVRDADLDWIENLLAGNNGEWEPILSGMRIAPVLDAIKGVGPVTVGEVIEACGVTSGRLCWADLTYQRRHDVARQLRGALEGLDPLDAEPADG